MTKKEYEKISMEISQKYLDEILKIDAEFVATNKRFEIGDRIEAYPRRQPDLYYRGKIVDIKCSSFNHTPRITYVIDDDCNIRHRTTVEERESNVINKL